MFKIVSMSSSAVSIFIVQVSERGLDGGRGGGSGGVGCEGGNEGGVLGGVNGGSDGGAGSNEVLVSLK
tara:strand:- start:72 stop:275 length:204 start_codon:yes stop_codon:yes gene_type:complete